MENLGAALKYKFPNLVPGIDFRVVSENGNVWLDEWNTDVILRPTESELQLYCDEYTANPPQPELSEIEQLKKQQADLTFTLMLNGVI